MTRAGAIRTGGAAALASLAMLLSGCQPWSYWDQKIDGPYRLFAADEPEQLSVAYDGGDGDRLTRVNETVFAVGWNAAYVVAARHPHARGVNTPMDRSRTEYFYIDRSADSPGPFSDAVHGPYDAAAFEAERARLKLPVFSKVIDQVK